jgi:putative DNA primase/helicase
MKIDAKPVKHDINDTLREEGREAALARQDRAAKVKRDADDTLREEGPGLVRERQDRAAKARRSATTNGAAEVGATTKVSATRPGSSEVVMVRASDVVVRKKNWLWEGHLLRSALEMLTGIPGLGKSQIQCSLIACATKGLPWPDGAKGQAAPVSVIMVTAEDALDQEVVPRLIAADADLNRVHILKCIKIDDRQRQFLIYEDLEKIEKFVAQIGGVGLITLDPITAYMGGRMDSHKTTEVRSQLGPLKDFAEHVDAAVSAITHPAKNPGKRAIDHYIASQAFIAAARIGHACFDEMKTNSETGENQPTGRVLFTHTKHNPSLQMPTLAYRIVGGIAVGRDGECGEPISSSRVVWEKEPVEITADQAAAAASGDGKKINPQSEVRDFLSRLLADGKPVAANEVMEEMEQLGFTKKQVRTAAGGLGVKKVKAGYGGGWEWSLPPPPF